MSSKQEDFTRVFIWVLAFLVLFTIVVMLVARSIGLNENSGSMSDKDIDARTKPYSTVKIAGEPEQMAAESAPAPAPAAETAAPAEAEAEPAAAEAEPAAEAAPEAAAAIDGQELYTACAACHATGAAGAPKVGDAAAWAPRVAAGMDTMVANAINGKGAMPPKGGRMDLSDEQIQAIVEYMVGASQ